MDLDRFRAPLLPAERQRRRPERLTARQRELLQDWGYPYVLAEYRWHMTLTDKIAQQTAVRYRQQLNGVYRRVVGDSPVVVDGVTLMRQARAGASFRPIRRYLLCQQG